MHALGERSARRSARRATALVGGLALLVTACGGGDGGGPAGGAEAAADQESTNDAGNDTGDGGEDGGEGGEGGEQVTLRFSWWGSDARHEDTQEVIDRFEAKYPHITVEGEFTGWGDYWDRLATTVAGGDAPDIIQHESRYLREYADRGALLDLNEVADTLDLSELDPLVADSGTVEGAVYGVPTGINAYTLFADPQAFEEAGVEMPDDTSWTWEDFVGLAAQISANSDYYGAQDKGYNETDLQIFARQRGEDMYTEDGQLGFSEQTAADWWQLGLEMQETAGTPNASITTEVQAGGVDQSLIATNRGAMAFFWTNELGALTDTSGRDLELLRYPGESQHEQPGMFFKPAMFYSVASTTAHPEEAALFLDFLLNDEQAADVIKSDRGLPANTRIREHVLADLSDAEQQAADFLAEIEDELATPPPVPPVGAGEIVSIVQRINEEVLFGRLSPDEAAARFLQEANAAIG
ncbi:ABC transporter substrate-binding protein [Egicoccus sp. AB-alg2]|uniref:ABC transporter substrate-binding protein n=1 Tax=Egicoccus sp. AB-alg2 TaxID=3242693 RepID=UPI00359EB573